MPEHNGSKSTVDIASVGGEGMLIPISRSDTSLANTRRGYLQWRPAAGWATIRSAPVGQGADPASARGRDGETYGYRPAVPDAGGDRSGRAGGGFGRQRPPARRRGPAPHVPKLRRGA